jgi:ethanolaminephosphotransferase
MFDHGCDALVTFVFTQSLGSIVGLDNAYYFAAIWFMASFPFFLNTWEEYYTGELNLPFIHGVSEGTVLACIAMHVAGFFGNSFWHHYVNLGFFQIRMNEIAVISMCLSGSVFGLISLYRVFRDYKHRTDTLPNLFTFITMLVTLLIVLIFADSDIIRNHPKLLIILYGLAFAKLVGHLQLAHLADAKFMQFRKSILISSILLSVVAVCNNLSGSNIIDIDKLIIALLILHVIGNNYII